MLLINWLTDFFQSRVFRHRRTTHKRRPQNDWLHTSQLLGQTELLEDRTLLSATVIHVDTFNDVVNAGDSVTSLREAIIQANTTAADFEIVLAAGTYTITIPGTNEDQAATGNV